jgi:hypothetical protein
MRYTWWHQIPRVDCSKGLQILATQWTFYVVLCAAICDKKSYQWLRPSHHDRRKDSCQIATLASRLEIVRFLASRHKACRQSYDLSLRVPAQLLGRQVPPWATPRLGFWKNQRYRLYFHMHLWLAASVLACLLRTRYSFVLFLSPRP